MNIGYEILKTAENKFNILAPKPFQILVMHRILEQDVIVDESEIRNQLVILPTGTGKSLCFQVPAVLCSGITVIVYPLLALMNDQKMTLERAGIEYVQFRGGQTSEQRLFETGKLKNGAKIVITNPETLIQPKILTILKQYKISLFVCDEAHVIAQWGNSFRPKYLELKGCIEKLRPHQILAFTATADEKTVKEITKTLFTTKPLIVRGNIDRENIYYCAVPCLDKQYALRKILDGCKKPALVFCKTRNTAYKLCMSALRENRPIEAKYYHAGLSKSERERIEAWFMNSANGVLFATCAYGMGVSKSNIRTVVHFDLPDNVLEYLQESGRAGRDGRESVAYVITEGKTDNPVEKIFNSDNCRRAELLKAMEQPDCDCTGCDSCCGEIKEVYGRYEIEKLVKMMPLKFTSDSIPWILGKQKDFRFVHNGFELNLLYRSLEDMNYDEIVRSAEKLVDDGVLGKKDFMGTEGALFYRKKV